MFIMKKVVLLLIVLVSALALCSCRTIDNKTPAPTSAGSETPFDGNTTAVPTSAPTVAPTDEPTEEVPPAPTPITFYDEPYIYEEGNKVMVNHMTFEVQNDAREDFIEFIKVLMLAKDAPSDQVFYSKRAGDNEVHVVKAGKTDKMLVISGDMEGASYSVSVQEPDGEIPSTGIMAVQCDYIYSTNWTDQRAGEFYLIYLAPVYEYSKLGAFAASVWPGSPELYAPNAAESREWQAFVKTPDGKLNAVKCTDPSYTLVIANSGTNDDGESVYKATAIYAAGAEIPESIREAKEIDEQNAKYELLHNTPEGYIDGGNLEFDGVSGRIYYMVKDFYKAEMFRKNPYDEKYFTWEAAEDGDYVIRFDSSISAAGIQELRCHKFDELTLPDGTIEPQYTVEAIYTPEFVKEYVVYDGATYLKYTAGPTAKFGKWQISGDKVSDTNVGVFKDCDIYTNPADKSIIYVNVNDLYYWPLVKE